MVVSAQQDNRVFKKKEGFQTVYVSFIQSLFPKPVQVGFVVDTVAQKHIYL